MYSVTVSDAHECVSEDTINVAEPDILEPDVIVEDAHCYDSADASVIFGATGGNGGYYYWWDNEPISGDIVENQHAGEHQLIVFDRKACQAEDVVSINQPEQIIIFAQEGDIISPDCEFSLNGEITITVEGGTPPYNYNWPEVFNNSTEHVEGLGVGSYTVVIIDNQNCTSEQVFTLENRLPACLEIPGAFTPNNDGRNDKWIILNPSNPEVPISELYPKMIIEIFDRLGQKQWISQPGYTDSVENGWNGEDRFGNVLPVDTYYYFIHLNNGTGLVIQDIVTIIR
jgi:gliding motility-associated-like protein